MEEKRKRAYEEFEKRNYDGALELFNQIIMHSPIHIEDMNALGVAYYNSNNFEGALTIFNEIFKVMPDFAPLLPNLARTKWKLAMEKNVGMKEQHKLLKEALSYDSSCYEIWYSLAQLYIKRNKLGDAMIAIQNACRTTEDILVCELLGKICIMNSRLTLAKDTFENILKRDPVNKEAIDGLKYVGSELQKRNEKSNNVLMGNVIYHNKFMQKICDGLWIGSGTAANNLDAMRKNNITHVLNVSMDVPNYFEKSNDIKITYKYEPFDDSENTNILTTGILKNCLDFITNAIDNDGNVFVHCRAGISRSGAIVIAYLMQTRKINYNDALRIATSSRECICPNKGFETQLKEYFAPRATVVEREQPNMYDSMLQNVISNKIMKSLYMK